MIMVPRKLKHRKVCKGSYAGVATRGFELTFGDYGLKALDLSLIHI